MSSDLDAVVLPPDQIGLLEGLTTTRAIRRYRNEPVPDELLRAVLFGASRAPSGSNRQPFRFLVLTDSPRAHEVKALLAGAAQRVWAAKEERDGYQSGSGADPASAKGRMAATMRHYVASMERVPVVVLPCLVRYREQISIEGASIFPAVQNLLLAARAVGLGGVITGFHRTVEDDLRTLLEIPAEAVIATTITLGWPAGRHGTVRRRPLREVVFEDLWGVSPDWAVDPPDTTFTSAGPRSS